jgi:hypothetical protein
VKRKVSTLYLILSVLLTGNILFTGIAANFLHDHEADHHYVLKGKGEAELHESSDDCLICSLDLIHELYFHSSTLSCFISGYFQPASDLQTLSFPLYTSYCDGRAPPSL